MAHYSIYVANEMAHFAIEKVEEFNSYDEALERVEDFYLQGADEIDEIIKGKQWFTFDYFAQEFIYIIKNDNDIELHNFKDDMQTIIDSYEDDEWPDYRENKNECKIIKMC